MIYSVTTYLQQTIASYLQALLSNSYIINREVLKAFPKNVRDDFINVFCTDKDHRGVNIPISLTFNAKKPSPYANILIQYKGGKELNNSGQSLGYTVGHATLNSGRLYRETSHLYYDNQKNLGYLKTNRLIYKVVSINNITGKIRKKGKRIYILNPITAKLSKLHNDKAPSIITYYGYDHTKHNRKRKYTFEGYDATEDYTIDIISSNINTIRCLSAVLKTLFLTMRLVSKAENQDYYLPKIDEQGTDILSQLNSQSNSTNYNQLFFDRFTLNYILTYSIPQKTGLFIKHLIPHMHLKGFDFQS